MDIDKERKHLTQLYKNDIKLLDDLRELGFQEYVSFISSNAFFLKDTTFQKNMDTLTIIRKTVALELKNYSMNTRRLCLSYMSDRGFFVYFFCVDVEEALKRVSNGKCVLEEVEYQVVCTV